MRPLPPHDPDLCLDWLQWLEEAILERRAAFVVSTEPGRRRSIETRSRLAEERRAASPQRPRGHVGMWPPRVDTR